MTTDTESITLLTTQAARRCQDVSEDVWPDAPLWMGRYDAMVEELIAEVRDALKTTIDERLRAKTKTLMLEPGQEEPVEIDVTDVIAALRVTLGETSRIVFLKEYLPVSFEVEERGIFLGFQTIKDHRKQLSSTSLCPPYGVTYTLDKVGIIAEYTASHDRL